MRLVETPDNPAPPGAVVSMARAVDGVDLRVVRWSPEGTPRGTLAVLGGRAEFIEKYFETIGEALAREFVVVAMDWRGQGLSARQLANPAKGHIDDFPLFERDLDALAQQALEPFCPRPWFGLAHSMGGAILLMQAHGGRSPFARIIATAPMIDIYGLRLPRAARLLAETLDGLGLGGAFVPGGKPISIMSKPFKGNPLTSDARRYARNAAIVAAEPMLALGDPTISWAHAAFRLIDAFADPEYPRRIQTPALIFSAGADHVVETRAVERFASRLKAGKLIPIPFAEHEILQERDAIRSQFWAAFDAFAPGETAVDEPPDATPEA
jgi:lysophospholipase